MLEHSLNIYTDGSSYSGPRTGGIGIRFITINELGNEVIQDVELPGYKGATNNQMELHACVVALQEARQYLDLGSIQSIEIYTDSQYVASNYKTAMFQWAGSRWRNREGRPVANADLWKDLIKLMKKCYPLRVNINWVKGHSRDQHNRAVDKIAKKSAKNPLNPSLTIVDVRRKKTEKSVEIGSVEMRRQRLRIRVITSEYLTVQRIYKYKYEVLSKGSRYFGNVDLIFSYENLKVGHHYEVSLNDNTSNPTINRLLREIER